MAGGDRARYYVQLTASDDLRNLYAEGPSAVLRYLVKSLMPKAKRDRARFKVVDLSSERFRLVTKKRRGSYPYAGPLIAAVEFEDIAALEVFKKLVPEVFRKKVFSGFGIDLSFDVSDHWCPGRAPDPLFGDRRDADRLIGTPFLRGRNASGQGVNVVVIDQGVDQRHIPNFGGGWQQGNRLPGQTKDGHGAMIVRNILGVAPDATIWDCPLIPEEISDIGAFLSLAQSAYDTMLTDIAALGGRWVFVNAWAIFSRKSEQSAPGSYTDNPNHPFNLKIAETVDLGIDTVFAAGNCGLFCPSLRCGDGDRGPGQSILGANSHPRVLTLGAVRTDTMWLGYSSQGPGQPHLAHDKPDLCAPSQFSEAADAYTGNTGTSAACGIAAGAVAALRTRWDSQTLPPDRLKQLLIDGARKVQGPQWSDRLGNGILDAEAAYRLAQAALP